jgi:RNA polymerase sigma-70 factor (ECF subfamily)
MPDLVERARGGDAEAFEQLYRQNVGRVYALCMRMTANPAEAEELTQEAFIRAWEKLSSFRGDASFSTWLHRVAANVVLSYRRSAARRRDRIVAEEDLSNHQDPEDRTNRGPGVDLEEAIAELPRGAREIFVLFDIEGYRHDEIAEMTGLATGTSKAQLHRARKLLREALNR